MRKEGVDERERKRGGRNRYTYPKLEACRRISQVFKKVCFSCEERASLILTAVALFFLKTIEKKHFYTTCYFFGYLRIPEDRKKVFQRN